MPVSMEFTAKGVNKGTAINGMCNVLGITADECMAFGDAGNDCEMLKYCKYSFAMANGTDECKKVQNTKRSQMPKTGLPQESTGLSETNPICKAKPQKKTLK